MILIYGNEDCIYCTKAKELLVLHKHPFIYISLSDIYHNDTWRNAFIDIKSIITKQTTIPIIFKKNETYKELPVFSVEGLKEWTLVGTYFDLVDLIEDLEDDTASAAARQEEKIVDISTNY